MLPRLLKLALDRLRSAFFALLCQTLGKTEQCTTVAGPSQDLSTKDFLSSRVIAVSEQHTTEHFTNWEIPVSRFGVISRILSDDGPVQKIDTRLLVSTSERDLRFELQFANLRDVGGRVVEYSHLFGHGLIDSAQRSQFRFSFSRLFCGRIRTTTCKVPERGHDL